MDPKLERLLASAKAAGATPEETGAFLRAHGYGPPTPSDATKVSPNRTPWVSPSEAGMLAADQMSFGLGKRASAALDAVMGRGTYGENVKEYQGKLDEAAGKYGAFASKIGGNLPLMAPTAALSPIKAGVVLGGLSGAGNSPAFTGRPGETLRQNIKDVGEYSGAGAAIGGALGGALGRIPGASPTAARIAAAKQVNVPLSVAQATDYFPARVVEGAVSYLPTGKIVTAPFVDRQAAAFGAQAEKMAQQLTRGSSVPSTEEAGSILRTAALDMGNRLEAKRAPLAQALGARIDAAHPDGVPLPGVQDLIDQWGATGQKITTERAMEIQPVYDRALQLVRDAKAGRINAAELLNRRTALGQDAHFSPIPGIAKADRSTVATKKLWSALRSDLEEAVQAADAGTGASVTKDALAAHDDLVQTFRSGGKQSRADHWARIAQEKPSVAVRQVMSQPGAKLLETQSELTPDEYGAVAASHFLNLGKAPPGVQDVTGGLYSPRRFLTQWNSLSPEVRAVIYPGLDLKPFVSSAGAATKNAIANPSGTAGAIMGASSLQRAFEGVGMLAQGAGTMAAGLSPAGAAALAGPPLLASLMTGQPIVKAAGLLGRAASRVAPAWNAGLRTAANVGPSYGLLDFLSPNDR